MTCRAQFALSPLFSAHADFWTVVFRPCDFPNGTYGDEGSDSLTLSGIARFDPGQDAAHVCIFREKSNVSFQGLVGLPELFQGHVA